MVSGIQYPTVSPNCCLWNSDPQVVSKEHGSPTHGLDRTDFTRYAAHQHPLVTEVMSTINQTMNEITSEAVGEASSSNEESEWVVISSDEHDDDDLIISDIEVSSDMREVELMDDLEM